LWRDFPKKSRYACRYTSKHSFGLTPAIFHFRPQIVQEADLIERNESAAALADGEVLDADAEAASNGLLVLRGSERALNSVPNCCAICLGNYEVGEKVVRSSNQGCPHAFHEECMVDWLTKMLDGTPCPCCRADFTDLEKFQRERRITWKAGNAFNPNRINLR
jgi:hypothetical protein